MSDGDCLHLIVQSTDVPPPPPAASAAAAPTNNPPSQAAAEAAAIADGMPPLTPNNALPHVPPTPFGFGFPTATGPGTATAAGIQFGPGIQFLPPGSMNIPGLPMDIGALMQNVLGGVMANMQQAPAAPAAAAAAAPSGSIPPQSGPAPTPSAAHGAAEPPQQAVRNFHIDIQIPPGAQRPIVTQTPPSTAAPSTVPTAPNAASASPSPPVVGSPSFSPLITQSHPSLSVNAVRAFLTEIGQNLPHLTSQPPLSMDPRATMSSAAVQSAPFAESLTGLAQLLAQTQAVVTQATPPLIYRLQNEVERLSAPLGPANSSHDSPAARVALQGQLRQLSPGLRRLGDSLRGLATLIEAIQVNPSTGESSLLILPPHLQPGRQMSVTHMVNVGGPGGMPMPMQMPMPMVGQHLVMNIGPNGQITTTQIPAGNATQAQSQSQSMSPPVASANAATSTPAPVNPHVPTHGTGSASASLSTGTGAPNAAPTPVASAPTSAPASAPVSAPQAAPAFNLASLLQQAAPMVGPLIANLSQSASGGGSISGGGGATAQTNPMANIMSALGPMFAGLQSQPVGPNHPAPAANAPAVTSQTQPTAANRSQQPAATPSAPAPAPSVSGAQPQPAPPAGVPNLGGMLGSLMPMIGQMMNQPSGGAAGGGAGSLQNIISTMMGAMQPPPAAQANSNASHAPDAMVDVAPNEDDDDDESSSASLFDMFLSLIMQHLSMPDLMSMMGGNFSGLNRVHGPMRELMMDLLGEDDSNENRELMTQSIASGIIDGLLDPETLSEVENDLIDDANPTRVSGPVVRKHVRRLLDIILDTPVVPVPPNSPPPPATPGSFAALVSTWCTSFCGEWLVMVGGCYRGGVSTSERIATSMVNRKVTRIAGNEMAMFMPMISGTIRQLLARAVQQYQQAQVLASDDTSESGDSPAWLQQIPIEDRQRWKETIQADCEILERRYQERIKADSDASASSSSSSSSSRSLYRPLSNAYLSGGKKRAAVPAPTAKSTASSSNSNSSVPDSRIADNLARTLRRSIESVVGSNSNSSSASVVASIVADADLQSAYTDQVAADMRTIIETRMKEDYSPERYPNIEAQVMNNASNTK